MFAAFSKVELRIRYAYIMCNSRGPTQFIIRIREVAHAPGITPLHFGGDPDSGSGT